MVEERLLRVALHVEQHLREPLSVERLAEVACISEYHFHRLFRLWAGEPVIEYVRRLRLEHAAYRLRATRRSVHVIAVDVGYESADAFGRAFRERFAMSPSDYRRRWAGSDAARVPGSLPVRRDEGADELEIPVTVRAVTRWSLVCLRKTGPYQEVWIAWRELSEWLQEHAPALADTPRIGISHDDPAMVDRDRIRYDACRAVPAAHVAAVKARLRPPFYWREMPAGDYAITRHRGPYHELGQAYRRLFLGWLPKSGRYPADAPVVERYLDSPSEVSEAELRTDLMLPVV
jgi:AraC family transcriptional regulator